MYSRSKAAVNAREKAKTSHGCSRSDLVHHPPDSIDLAAFDHLHGLQALESWIRRVEPCADELVAHDRAESATQSLDLPHFEKTRTAEWLRTLPIGDRPLGKACQPGKQPPPNMQAFPQHRYRHANVWAMCCQRDARPWNRSDCTMRLKGQTFPSPSRRRCFHPSPRFCCHGILLSASEVSVKGGPDSRGSACTSAGVFQRHGRQGA